MKLLKDQGDRVSGIHDVTFLSHAGRDGVFRNIVLMGERHNHEGSCKSVYGKRTADINTVVEHILRTQTGIDFFLEANVNLRVSKEVEGSRESEYLDGLRARARELQIKSKLPKNTRVHYSDVRDMLGCPSNYTVFGESGLSGFINKTMIDEEAVKRRSFRRLCIEMLDEIFLEMLYNTVLQRDDDSFIPHSLISKQIAKSTITDDDTRLWLADFKVMKKDFIAAAKTFIQEDYEDIEEYRINLHMVSQKLNEMWAWVHDVYTLARMFKPYTRCIVFYGGSFHCTKMSEYIRKIGGKIELKLTSPDNEWSCLNIEGGAKSVYSVERHFGTRMNGLRRIYNDTLQ